MIRTLRVFCFIQFGPPEFGLRSAECARYQTLVSNHLKALLSVHKTEREEGKFHSRKSCSSATTCAQHFCKFILAGRRSVGRASNGAEHWAKYLQPFPCSRECVCRVRRFQSSPLRIILLKADWKDSKWRRPESE